MDVGEDEVPSFEFRSTIYSSSDGDIIDQEHCQANQLLWVQYIGLSDIYESCDPQLLDEK